jgi:hypothetical protein
VARQSPSETTRRHILGGYSSLSSLREHQNHRKDDGRMMNWGKTLKWKVVDRSWHNPRTRLEGLMKIVKYLIQGSVHSFEIRVVPGQYNIKWQDGWWMMNSWSRGHSLIHELYWYSWEVTKETSWAGQPVLLKKIKYTAHLEYRCYGWTTPFGLLAKIKVKLSP